MSFYAAFRAAALQEELGMKSSALGQAQKHVEKLEQEQSDIKTRLVRLTEDGNVQKAELEKKLQGMSTEHQKTRQEKEAQSKELQKVNEALTKASTALKESQTQLEKEKKSSTAALVEKVGSVMPVFLQRQYIYGYLLLLYTLLQVMPLRENVF